MKQLTGIYLMGALIFSSCAGNEVEMVNEVKAPYAVTLTYTIPDAAIDTRAASYVEATGNESVVDGLHLLFFHSDNHGNGSFVASASATLKDADLKQNSISVTLPGAIVENDEYSVLVVANLARYTSVPDTYLATFGDKTYAQAWSELQAMLALTDGKYNFPDGRLPMSGTTVKEAGRKEMSVDLLRAAVRIDVAVSTALATTTLNHAGLRNIAPVVPFFRTQEEISLSRVASPQFTVTGNKITGGLYAVETSLDVSDRRVALEDATCLLVDVHDPAVHTGDDADKTWYRVDLNISADKRQFLKRNNAYTILITKVNGPGATTPDGAYYGEKTLIIEAVTVPSVWKSSGVTPPDIIIQ